MDNQYWDEDDFKVYQEDQEDEVLGLTKATSYSVLKGEELEEFEKIRNNLIQQTSEFTSLIRDESIRLLILFKWNLEDLKDKFYDNSEKNLIQSGINQSQVSLSDLASKGVKTNNKECPICFTEGTDSGTLFSLKCKHYFCCDCWYSHLSEKISQINSVIYAKCPQESCNLYVNESLFYKFFDKKDNQLTLFRKALLKNFTENNSEIKWCPEPNCGACIRCTVKSSKEIDCICGSNFCFKCLKNGHRPCSCEMNEYWAKKLKTESNNVKWIEVNTKQCPKCSKYIEKNQGCNHMTCRTTAGGCGHEFCWLCFADWKNHGTCNKYEEKSVKQEKKLKDVKSELQRFIFYFDRYSNHDKALKHALRLRNSIEYFIQFFEGTKNIPLSELYFLRNGVEITIKSRKFLKNTYIFGYYFKDQHKKEKKLYEHEQSLLEMNADRLLELLENDTLNNILAINDYFEFSEEFKLFRNTIISLSSATERFLSNLMTEIENNMLYLVDNQKLLEK